MTRYSLVAALALSATSAFAQPGDRDRGRGDARDPAAGIDALVERLLTFDANKDGSLAKSELTDERLHSLFDRADANKDGTATKAELKELLAKESAAIAATGRRGPMGGGPDGGQPGPGGPQRDGDRGRGPMGEGSGRGGQFGPAGPPQGDQGRGPGGDFRGQRPRPGQVLPPGVQERLGLSDDQRRRVDALQEIVDTQLEKILTAEQKKMLSEFGPPQGAPGNFQGPRGEGNFGGQRGDGPGRGEGGPQRGEGGPRDRQRPNSSDRPTRPATEP